MKSHRFYSTPAKIILWVIFIIFSVYAFTLIFPFAWMFVNSFKTNQEFFTNVWALPQSFSFRNYTSVLGYNMQTSAGTFNITHMFLLSVGITLAATVINTLLSTMAAYVIARYKFKGRNLLYSVALFTLIMPIVGTLPAQFRLMQNLGLYNSIFGILILYSGSFGFTFFIMHGYFKNISPTYAEAAFVDGASDFQVFLRIMLPMAKPIMISLAIIYGIGIWNDYITPSIYLKNYPTLAVGIRYLTQTMVSTGAYAEMFATMIISIVPILAIFIAFRNTIMENMVAGGLKG
ncbi:carbohydrate ABC transporter permease [Acholeplasma laidlawii]|uniref:ABC-type transport system, permease component n=2 Tax=Acholeplasma laidlawii TaxID=2148 RepID=A9NH46_ACHLI|nr:carbohydrate ABC transporter permease [Acholeplasma laidlawii]ABX81676.1 ABC-type transport system, permease component [Acholeplasma laidlawii PG-8A]NWH09746.1 carbohydrate ABC transporter permease [Acholeplasma laidlawii]NWH11138.1 carbohydrate ABC transporter permease [Acholeplasma laidlawii]NWH13451.1 carbohydrate ABC transporter permease [Acholeplasma laidlawii]NWH14570.1 carbohydrate ABC transporter permease [Acholeplasma laidlawii]